MNRVTWFQARYYCRWRRMRLPTEVEWEYAARGPERWVYPWGDGAIPNYAVYRSNSEGRTADVGSRPAGTSWVGALDMSGNVWEWVSSMYAPYAYDESHENDSDNTSARVLRGGSFITNSLLDLRSSERNSDSPTSVSNNYGFRCVKS